MAISARLAGKVAVVTGAAQGIGKAIALRFADEGADVVVVADRVEKYADEVVDTITAKGVRALAVVEDLETYSGATNLMQTVIEKIGRIDVSVHNVGGTIWAKPFWEYEEKEIEKEILRSLWPTLWCCRAVIPHMLDNRSGSIINIGSQATRGKFRVPYSAAKGGVSAMTTAMALELAEHNIRVNCVSPGGVDVGERVIPRNPQDIRPQDSKWMQQVFNECIEDYPMRRLGLPEEEAAAVAFFASEDASFVTGQTLFVAGGAIG